MTTKSKIFLGIAMFYIAYTVLPAFSGLIRFPVWLPSAGVTIVLFCMFPRIISKSRTFLWFLIYGVIAAIYLLSGRTIKLDIGSATQVSQLLIEYSFLLPNILIATVLSQLSDIRLYKVLFYFSIIVILVSFLLLIPQLRYTDLRALANMLEEGRSRESIHYINYTLLHVYVIVLPAILYRITLQKNRLFYIAFAIITYFIVIKSSITTIVLISLCILILSLLYNRNRVVSLIGFAGVSICGIFLYYSGLLVTLLDWVAPFYENTAVEYKIADMRESLVLHEMTGGSITVRQSLHARSWRSFFSNIVFGGSDFGGHSSLIDRLACMGCVGFIPYIMIYISVIRRWKGLITNKEARYFYSLGILVVFVLLYSKGLFGSEGNLFYMVLLPLFITYIQYDKQRCNSKSRVDGVLYKS